MTAKAELDAIVQELDTSFDDYLMRLQGYEVRSKEGMIVYTELEDSHERRVTHKVVDYLLKKISEYEEKKESKNDR